MTDKVKNQLQHYKTKLLKLNNSIKAHKQNIETRTVVGIVLVLVGVSLASFPYLQNIYYQRIQEKQVAEKLEELEQDTQVLNSSRKKLGYRDIEIAQSELNDPEEDPKNENPSLQSDEDKSEEEEFAFELEPADGLIEIPKIDLQLAVGFGVELSDLAHGPGFYPESGRPETGNLSIAGHRTTYGGPFRHLNELDQGDSIRVYREGKKYRYEVDRVFDTHSSDWSVIRPTDDPALTLTTCHPPGSDERRLIVRAYLTKEKDQTDTEQTEK
ncbi:class E sortase [Natranaerobius thermophilus]|uniref:Sortase family protein n=1 Tax=Natranaerobius thermophilus (strain ATCC BAA-1301 / DSM 18059 / JW/NM-WN-LF) TaxID=457570 RepID=B2A7H4_NATTJ|nr:class E sortase [Natranaerobius thermophilus]ACB85683.1 sortase family protein [Natranaerobius thermophilus JW/NM-WN-LF]